MELKKEIEHLTQQIDFLERVIIAISPSTIGHSELTSVIGPILTLNKESLKSMLLLAENTQYRDMIILSRPFLEGTINIGFICAEGDNAIINSKKYAYQKGYRDLFHGIDINGFKIEKALVDHVDEIEKAAPNHMKKALADFTTKSGKEINSWTPETTKQKLEKIGKTYGLYVNGLLTFAFYSIYRDVSEIIHNSYYGARIYLGMQQKDMSAFKSSGDAAKFFSEHQERLATLFLQQINISINALLNILSQKFPIDPIKEIFTESNAALVTYADSFKTTADD
ncbi:DUF5677 domain-containing protein [Chryseosolibacter indicus]|uniref:Uncharacterized protein n=1 Tax=Chryseosolibacter indicus TaxID=2782351 RepID=A0ABS5VYM9_9BACT|nr:DUF5677 domain-containing protein [Chryseosolibacter indicus]MBT1706518.1 hypothetical protein [Chryseosolibacter indicus]